MRRSAIAAAQRRRSESPQETLEGVKFHGFLAATWLRTWASAQAILDALIRGFRGYYLLGGHGFSLAEDTAIECYMK